MEWVLQMITDTTEIECKCFRNLEEEGRPSQIKKRVNSP